MDLVDHFDPALQMFVSPPREPNTDHLLFLRWLIERGRLESARNEDGDACRCHRCCAALSRT